MSNHNKNIAIKVQNITKTYKLYDNPIDRLKEALNPLKKRYHKKFNALNRISFEIKKGDIVGILGKNGSGKSTLLKIITGVLTPTNGHIHVNGNISAILELGAGFNPEMTGLENIYLNTSINGMNKKETDKKIDAIISFAELNEFIYQPIKTYSSGMKARLAFSVAINVDPDILIVDEALAVGDMNFQAKCMTAMVNIKERGTTILFVSHSIDSIKSLCNKAIYLKNGNMIDYGESKDITEFYIQEMRNNQNQINNKKSITPNIELKIKNKDFQERVNQFRHGTGSIKIVNVELLDNNDQGIDRVEFNQKVKIRISIHSINDENNISVNFHLFDAKKIKLSVGNFKMANEIFLDVKKNECYEIDYILNLPIAYGNYSIQTAIIKSIEEDEIVEFIDVIPDACVFNVGVRPNGKLWGKVDLFPTLEIKKV